MTFSTSLDNQAKLVTVGLLLLLFSASVLPLFNLKFFSSPSLYFDIPICLLPIAIICYYFLLKPVDYIISDKNVIIRRRIKTIILTEENIINVKLFHSDLLKNQGYISGVKGVFGYIGKTYQNGVGIFRWYGTRKDKTVLITTRDHRRIIITPDEPEEFVNVFYATKQNHID